MPANKEPKLWLTILKLVIGAVALVSLVWFCLSLLSSYTDDAPGAPTKSKMDWGIANDSPVPSRR